MQVQRQLLKEWGFPSGSVVKNLPTGAGDASWEDPLEEEMAIHFSILAWEIPWIVERGGLQSMGVSKELDTTQQLNNSPI